METNKFITTSESTSPSTPPYPFLTTSSQTSPSRTLPTKPLNSVPPNACFPSSGSSSRTAFSMVRYRLQTLILVVRDAFAIGAESPLVLVAVSSPLGGLITGSIVERDSGSLRVRNKVEDCRYILDICEEACREEVLFDRILEDNSCDEECVSRAGLRAVAIDVEEGIALGLISSCCECCF